MEESDYRDQITSPVESEPSLKGNDRHYIEVICTTKTAFVTLSSENRMQRYKLYVNKVFFVSFFHFQFLHSL